MTTTQDDGFLPEGYPETLPPPHGHPAYLLFAHLLNATTVQPGDAWVPLDQREAAARRALTVAVWNVREALWRASAAVVDLPAPVAKSGGFQDGYNAAQNDIIEALDALEERLIGGVKSTVDMAIPDVPDQSS